MQNLEDDNRGQGVYKGVFAGDDITGTYVLEISSTARGVNDVYDAVVQVDLNGTDYEYTGTATELADGSFDVQILAEVSSSDFELNLNISSVGVVNNTSLEIDGSQIDMTCEKEIFIEGIIELWQGTWGGQGAAGVWNYTRTDTTISGAYYGSDGTNYYNGTFSGSIDGATVTVDTFYTDIAAVVSATGTLSSTTGGGTWIDYYGGTGSWSGERTR